jgi:hypothetical protein
MKRLVVFQNKPLAFGDSRMNHHHRYWDKRMLTIVEITFCKRHALWLPLVNKKYAINELVAISIVFFDLV